ncbi:MAG: phosphoglycerate kinase [Candidatus Omnitrophota bacterium]|jgi:enolase
MSRPSKNNSISKIISGVVIAQFIMSSIALRGYAGTDNLRPAPVKDSDRISVLADELQKDGGKLAEWIHILAENTIVGDAAKGSNVGMVIRLGKLVEENISGSILGHSANRKAYIKEVGAQIAEGLRLTGMEEKAIAAASRKIAFSRYDNIMNHRIQAMFQAGIREICLCVGSDKDKLTVEEEISDVLAQLQVSFADVSLEQIKKIIFHVAWEPAANIGTGTAVGPEKIKLVHQAIYEFFAEKYNTPSGYIGDVWGKSLKILYGASVDGKNVDGIMAVKEDKGMALVHGVLFASSGKKADGFLAVAEGVSRAAERDNAQYVCFVNLKEFARAEKDEALTFVVEIVRAIALGRIDPRHTILAIADQDVHLKEWQDAIVGRSVSMSDGGYAYVEGTNFKDKNVLFRPDYNTPASVKTDDQGNVLSIKISDASRIVDSFPALTKILKDKPKHVVVVVHFEPKVLNPATGKKDKKNLSTKVTADKLKELLPAEYKDKVIFLADSVNDNGIAAEAMRAIESYTDSEIIVLENVRFAKGEKKGAPELNDPKGVALRKQLSGLADEYVVDALGNIHRAHASMLPLPGVHKVMGSLVEKEIKVFNRILNPAHPYAGVNGGNKVEDKVDTMDVSLSTMQEGDAIIIGGAMAYTFLKAQDPTLKLGKSLVQADKVDLAKTILEKAARKKVRIILPVDHRISDKLAPGAAELVTEGLEVPDGYMAVDIGPKTEKIVAEVLSNAQTAFWNGPMGAFEDEAGGFNKGTYTVARELQKMGRSGRLAGIGGGETRMAAIKAGVTDADGVFMSSGGGSTQEYFAKKGNLPVIKNLENDETAQKNLVLAGKLGVEPADLARFEAADSSIYNALGDKLFNGYISQVRRLLPRFSTGQKLNGALSKAEVSAEVIKDSRGNNTVRATLKIGDIVTVGEVPAGASKGAAEAFAFPPKEIDRAIANVAKIQEILKNSGLDISKHSDLRKTEQLIIAAAGENFATLGANATVPISWALWRMAAALNNMELWEYIRINEPGVVGNDPVYFYMNIYNGGLHASGGDASVLGTVWTEFQEMLIVPVGAKTHAEGVAMGDKIDQELKKILKGKFAEADIMRKDEAGFAVKGLGKSEDAIAYVVQAIRNAGYEPGKDVKLALDVAATSFYDEKENIYKFQGQKLTSAEMVDFYVKLVKQYDGLFLSIEDGLAEEDWQGWVELTPAMKEKGVLTIGDDLYVTQHGRFNKGLAMNAATAILIKVNQNGTLGGTIDVMKTAKANGIKAVVSHRSGETLDAGIADLAYATRAFGLKTGDPQPLVDFQNPKELVRRAKYERMIEIQKNENIQNDPALSRPKALLIDADFFKSGAVKNAVAEIAKLNGNINVVIYGDNAENLKTLVGNSDIIAVRSLTAAVSEIANRGVKSSQDAVILTPMPYSSETFIVQIRSGEISTLALAKAVKQLFKNDRITAAMDEFYKSLADNKVVSERDYINTREKILTDLIDGVYNLGEIKLTKQVSDVIEKERLVTEEFVGKV